MKAFLQENLLSTLENTRNMSEQWTIPWWVKISVCI